MPAPLGPLEQDDLADVDGRAWPRRAPGTRRAPRRRASSDDGDTVAGAWSAVDRCASVSMATDTLRGSDVESGTAPLVCRWARRISSVSVTDQRSGGGPNAAVPPLRQPAPTATTRMRATTRGRTPTRAGASGATAADEQVGPPAGPARLALLRRQPRQGPDRDRSADVRVRRLPAVGHRHRDRTGPEPPRERVRATRLQSGAQGDVDADASAVGERRFDRDRAGRRIDRCRRHRPSRSTPARHHRRRRDPGDTWRSRSISPTRPSNRIRSATVRRGDPLAPARDPARSAATTSSCPASGSTTSRTAPGTTPTPHCRASSATRRSPATARPTARRSSTSTSSSPGDELIVTMINGDRFVYEVTGIEVVAATDYWVVTTRNPRHRRAHPHVVSPEVHRPRPDRRAQRAEPGQVVERRCAHVLRPRPRARDQVDEPSAGDDPVVTAAAEAPPDDTTDTTGTTSTTSTTGTTAAPATPSSPVNRPRSRHPSPRVTTRSPTRSRTPSARVGSTTRRRGPRSRCGGRRSPSSHSSPTRSAADSDTIRWVCSSASPRSCSRSTSSSRT